MRNRAFLCFLILCVSLFFPAGTVLSASGEDEWQSIEPGIDYRAYLLPGPNRVFVARMDRSQENVILDTSIAQGRLAYGAEKVSNMAARYEDALNFWDYPAGFRNHVSVAINGSFVNPGTSVPYSGVIQSGWYAKRYDNFSGVSFGWKFHQDILKRNAFIGDCVYHEPVEQYITNISKKTKRFLLTVSIFIDLPIAWFCIRLISIGLPGLQMMASKCWWR
jgi:hypothetical protein